LVCLGIAKGSLLLDILEKEPVQNISCHGS